MCFCSMYYDVKPEDNVSFYTTINKKWISYVEQILFFYLFLQMILIKEKPPLYGMRPQITTDDVRDQKSGNYYPRPKRKKEKEQEKKNSQMIIFRKETE